MKKMQCEVCGSTEIRKVSDDVFECQSCGIQYSKGELQKLLVEITGAVKIDHSNEIDNILIRAAQFLENGDLTKAFEYYNKVLDLDPKNENAQQGINAIHEKQDAEQSKAQHDEKIRASTIKVLKHTINPEDGITHFFKSLKNAPDIAPDIFNEIEIISAKQGYYPFSAVNKQYSGTYTGIACYRKQIPYTDYETRTDFTKRNSDGTFKKTQVAVTKYREEIDRKNVNGAFDFDHFRVFSVSGALNSVFTSMAPDQYDEALSDDKCKEPTLDVELQRTLYNDVILKQIEKQLTAHFNSLQSAFTEIQSAEEKTIGTLEIYNETSDTDWEKRVTDLFTSQARRKAGNRANRMIPGDFNENVHYRWAERNSQIQTVYFPVQTIEYAYRGKFYVAAMLLVDTDGMLYSYPCTTELKQVESNTEDAITQAKRKPFPPLLITLYGFAIVGLAVAFWNGVVEGKGSDAVFWGILGGICIVPSIIWHIIWKSKTNAAIKQEVSENTDFLDDFKTKYNLELAKGAQEFFKVFNGLASLENAVAAAKKVSTYRPELSTIKGRNILTSMSSNQSVKFANKSAKTMLEIKDTNGQNLVAGSEYCIRMMESGNHQFGICKILRDACGIGLASAKEMISTCPCVVAQKLSSEDADHLASELLLAGALIEIEKEI